MSKDCGLLSALSTNGSLTEVLSGVALTTEGAPHGAFLKRLASLPTSLPVHVREIWSRVCARRCACRLDLANVHRHTHHSSHHRCRAEPHGRIWLGGRVLIARASNGPWFSKEMPFFWSNYVVVATNRGPWVSLSHDYAWLSFSPSFPALQQVPASCLTSPYH